PLVAGDLPDDLGEGRLGARELAPRERADRGQGDEAVQDRDDAQREHDGPREVPLWVSRLLAGGGGGVEPDVGEEQRGGTAAHAGQAEWKQRSQVAGADGGEGHGADSSRAQILVTTIAVLTRALSVTPRRSTSMASATTT